MRGWSWLEKTQVGQRSPMTSSTCAMRARHAPRLPRHRQRLEVEGEVQLVAVAEVGRDQLGLGEVDLADHHAVAGVLVEHGANAAQQRVRALVVVRADDVEVAADDVGLRDVGQRGVLADEVHDVGAEAVDAAVQPEAQHVVHRLDDLRVVPVEVGLLGQEGVQVPLLGGLVPRPRGAAAEGRRPVVGRMRPACRRASGTSRAWASRATRGSRRTTDAGRRCGWAPSPAARGCRARARRPAGRRRPRGRRRAGRRRSSRPRRSRSRPSASGRSATARARRPRATAGAPGARAGPRGRRRRRPTRRRTSADRSGRRPTPATTCGGEGYGPATRRWQLGCRPWQTWHRSESSAPGSWARASRSQRRGPAWPSSSTSRRPRRSSTRARRSRARSRARSSASGSPPTRARRCSGASSGRPTSTPSPSPSSSSRRSSRTRRSRRRRSRTSTPRSAPRRSSRRTPRRSRSPGSRPPPGAPIASWGCTSSRRSPS